MASTQSADIRVAVVCAVDVSVRALLKPQIIALEHAGYQVDAVCSDGPEVDRLRSEGLRIEVVEISRAIRPWQDVKSIYNLYRLFRRGNYKVIHTHTPKASFLAQIAGWLARVPVRINTLHGLYYLAANGVQRKIFKLLEVVSCRLSHHIFSQSNEDVEMLKEEKLVASRKLQWLGNGIDIRRFDRAQFSPDEGAHVRRELNIPEDAFVVGIVARMVTEKGFWELFEAFKELHATAPNAYLLHIGFIDTSRNDELTPAAAEQYGIAEWCRFTGQRDDISRLMTAMDIFVLPSYREGYPRSVMEANGMGLPAIVTDIRGCREAVVDGVNGLLIPPRAVEPLAAALERLFTDRDLRARLSQGARQRAVEVFDEQLVIRKLLDVYQRLAGIPSR